MVKYDEKKNENKTINYTRHECNMFPLTNWPSGLGWSPFILYSYRVQLYRYKFYYLGVCYCCCLFIFIFYE